MRVLILGATGFIGFPAAQAFVRAGHIVYGQTRSAAKAKQLAAEEIIPVVAAIKDTSTYLHLVSKIDVIIEALGGTERKETSDFLLSATARAVQEHRPAHAPKLTYIYTSGAWVHGEHRYEVVSDTTPLTRPTELVSWRPAFEQRVITNPNVNGVVIRPSLLYGRSGSLLARLFKSAYDGEAKWFGSPGGRFALIHADDLADVYVLAAEKAPIVRGQILDASNDVNESVDAVLQRLVEISGAKSYTFVEPSNVFEVSLTTTGVLRPYLARSLLGWRPRKAGLLDHLDIYYQAWKASEGLE
ncbi:NAD(P)-binding protein [Fomes fomentarius]|nr:NAD(P)-binding protein [Fomes fomentarius]